MTSTSVIAAILRVFATGLALFGGLAPSLLAQDAAISGRVMDSSGAVVPFASLQLTGETTGITRSIEANQEGIYFVPSVSPGQYTLTADVAGFKRFERTGITLETAQTASINITLEIGASAETVTVDGSGVNINVSDASVSTIVDRGFVSNIPLNGRSVQSLLTLVPGVSMVPVESSGGGRLRRPDFGQRTADRG